MRALAFLMVAVLADGAAAGVVAAQTQVGPGTLAEAAKRAAEARKLNKEKAIRIEVGGEHFTEVALDELLVQRYSDVRVNLARLWNKDDALFQRVRSASMAVKTLREFAAVLASEPDVKSVIEFQGFTPLDLVRIDVTLQRADVRTEGGYGKLSPLEQANTDYMGRQGIRIHYLRVHWAKVESGRAVWPEWVPY
jgi:hypothetical protein